MTSLSSELILGYYQYRPFQQGCGSLPPRRENKLSVIALQPTSSVLCFLIRCAISPNRPARGAAARLRAAPHRRARAPWAVYSAILSRSFEVDLSSSTQRSLPFLNGASLARDTSSFTSGAVQY
eukprot:6211198-Pleurochrysis_carterae.AAC.2